MTSNANSLDKVAVKLTRNAAVKVSELDGDIQLLAVKYDGNCFANEAIDSQEIKYKFLCRVSTRDLVLSNINAVNGAIGVVPEELEGCYVSSEYTVLKVKPGIDPYILQLILRSPECRADLLLNASGIGRHRITLAGISKTEIPYPHEELASSVLEKLEEARELQLRAKRLFGEARNQIIDELKLNSASASEILKAFKPPK